jgi:alanyl-tRNA synthetase
MLGNWSFGDYFKAEAIQWAWELLTDVWGMPKDRLYVTVFEGDASDGLEADTEAAELWKTVTDVDPSHIVMGNKKDNFWEMGDTGPCGPCSEIHIDLTPDRTGAKLINADSPQAIEIWNLVFIQFNRLADGRLEPLPAKHVDTGMGLERVGMVLQGKSSNYATDLFVPIIEKIETLTDHRYGASSGLADRFDVAGEDDAGDVACRVIADHARALTFAIADGILPSNEGRGYVLRRILRRAARYGRQHLNIEGPFVVDLVGTITEMMGEAFPEIVERRSAVEAIIREEEESFGKTLDRGIDIFQKQAQRVKGAGGDTIPGEAAFELYATYGFPVDLTQIMADDEGLSVDVAGFEAAMAEHRQASKGESDSFRTDAIVGLPATDSSAKYERKPIETKVLGWVEGDRFIESGSLAAGCEAAVVLERTNFYGQQGGQVGDTGELTFDGGRFVVRDTQIAGQCVLHLGTLESGELSAGQLVTATVDPRRLETMRNHTATHLLNWALRRVLGEGVDQAGSEVGPDRLRFDFTHGQSVPAEQLRQVEQLVNERVLADEPVAARVMPLAEAKEIPGVRAVFGEKYPDPVRVISVGSDASASVEFCGGTHLDRTSQVGLFKIVGEESVAKGVRRITALTGRGAVDWAFEADDVVGQVSSVLRAAPAEIADRVVSMQKEIKQLRKRPAGGGGGGELEIVETLTAPQGDVLIGKVGHDDPAAMRTICDQKRNGGAAAVLLAGADGQKVVLVAMVSDEMVKAGGLKAGDWVKAAAQAVGGGGGGKPTLAQAGGKQPEKLPEALTVAAEYVRRALD